MMVDQVKCWGVLPHTLDSFVNNRLPKYDNTGIQMFFFFFGCGNSLCFLIQNIAVHFKYQKHIHFRNGQIVIG
jgi:hypothetical protein